jgi:CRISPR-associated protein Cmr5
MTTSVQLEQARHVHECLAKVPTGQLKDYANRLKGAPAELMDNGLLQMLAFYHAKQGAHELVAKGLEDWLRKRGLVSGEPLVALSQLDAVRYRRCSEEALAWLNWAKRLALARLATAGSPTTERGGRS